MSERNNIAESDHVGECVRALNHTIGDLARRYGPTTVVAALTEIMGCASCISENLERAANIHSQVERMCALERRT
jgi:hypothetical protein